MNGIVGALAIYENRLIVEGIFTVAGKDSVNYMAAWDGSSWSSLGDGVNGNMHYARVFALTIYDGKLIAGGEFTTASGIPTNKIATWDGSTWSSLGSGMGGGDLNSVHVYTLTVYDGKLIAGGDFTVINGILVNRIAAWNGVSWLSLGSGMNNTVSSLTVYDGKLIAGGYFSTAGGISANHIAAWDGAIWSPLGEGRGKDSDFTNISAFTVYEGILRVC